MPEARLQRTREAYRKPDAFIELAKKLRAEALVFVARSEAAREAADKPMK